MNMGELPVGELVNGELRGWVGLVGWFGLVGSSFFLGFLLLLLRLLTTTTPALVFQLYFTLT